LVYDAINDAYADVLDAHPANWGLQREKTIEIVSGTAIYEIDDWCAYPMSFFVTDANETRQLPYYPPSELDRNGMRSSSVAVVYDPFILEWYQPTTVSLASGTQASVNDGSTAVSKATGDDFASAHEGRMMMFQGQDYTYEIDSVTDATNLVLASAYRGRVSGDDEDNTAANLSNVPYDIAPAGRYRFRVVPSPTSDQTIYCRYRREHTMLMTDTDWPKILPLSVHAVLPYGAVYHYYMANGNTEKKTIYEQEFLRRTQTVVDRLSRSQWPTEQKDRFVTSISLRNNVYGPGKTWRR
jgi:hypothetical protein